MIKIVRVEHIQDGIERLEFTAGLAAVQYMHRLEDLLTGAADAFSVQTEALPATAQRFFGEWKDQRKEIERLSAKVTELELSNLTTEEISGRQVLIRQMDLPSVELVKVATSISSSGGIALLIAGGDTARAVVASGDPGLKAGDLIASVCTILGGKGGGKPNLAQGGGPDVTKIDEALAAGKELITTALHG